jgi:hypothetical protein
VFEAKKRPATRAAAVRALASFSSEIQMVVDRLGGQPGFLESRTMVDAARSWPGAQLSRLSFDMALMHLREEDQGRTGTTH